MAFKDGIARNMTLEASIKLIDGISMDGTAFD